MTSQGNTLNIAVICGGDSGEYEISIQSGKMVAQTLDRTKYTPYLIVVKGNTWVYTDADGSEIQLCRTDFSLPLLGQLFDLMQCLMPYMALLEKMGSCWHI